MSSNTYTLNLSKSEITVLISALAIAESRHMHTIKSLEPHLGAVNISQPELEQILDATKLHLEICKSLVQKLINLPLVIEGEK
ncbi:hypothetical protein [Pseudoalteromonas gelatinilytica]|uniref:Uncharacterized protein n=1 Tax=Pseudoalteromonas gelatinilytica TaxID=1703256 RepID=A0ABQ1TPW3_9GAMM|nr:hypothetical protein [Pseudoalteromonas profundi]GGF00564.1 hypothetical protein GCM10008027_26770 [Pseudoalteromonas profundi]